MTNWQQIRYCYLCCNPNTVPTNCIYGQNAACGKRSEYFSCENQTPKWKYYFPTFVDKRIDCMRLGYIDYNRYRYAKAYNVESPQDVWAIDFWFKTATNQAVKEIGKPQTFTADGNNNNFNEFEIEWNYHNKIRVYKEVISELENTFTYKVECTPIVVDGQPGLSSQEIININIGNVHYIWTYISCGVNFQEKNFFLTDNNKMSDEKSFTSKFSLIPLDSTTLTIRENSRPGYGFTIIYQLRLWHCYNCALSHRNHEYKFNNPSFSAVSHDFHGTIEPPYNVDSQPFIDKAQKATADNLIQAADYPGYTLNIDPGKPAQCDENIYEYYNEKNQACERHFDASRMGAEKKIAIPSSRSGRYTMDFWFYVESGPNLTPGFNLFWENHMSVTMLKDSINTNTINAICFPQNYIDNVDEKSGQDIMIMYDKALNKDKYAFYQGSSKWNFVRCAVDQTRKRFFINDNIELDLEGEILYGTTKNYRPFRNFKIGAKSNFKIQNTQKNPTRIFLRQIKCYREYIDFRLMELKYKACAVDTNDKWYNYCYFYPLVFCFDYGEMLNPNFVNCDGTRTCFTCPNSQSCGLIYHMYEERTENVITPIRNYWRDFLVNDIEKNYTTYPDIYKPYFCEHGFAGGDKEPCVGSFNRCRLRNSTALFWPDTNNNYLDLNTLTQKANCDSSCRPPDSYYLRNFCLMDYQTNNMISCSSKGKDIYYEDFKCKPGYTKVYYECIESSLIPKSALYFSNIYSFPNTVFDATDYTKENFDYLDWKEETRIPSYYLEIWMKFDLLNYRNVITNTEYYLYAHPHQIIKDPRDQKYKYSNKLISSGYSYYTLNSLHNYEWNHIIIENLYDYNTQKFSIKFYLNKNFDNPEFIISELDSSLYKMHFRGLGFCDKVDDSYCRINNEAAYLRWGVAWYRNFRVWDAEITTLDLIQNCDYGYTQSINAQKYYFSLTADTLVKNTIQDRISPDKNKLKLNYWTFNTGTEYLESFDNDMRINYSTDNFDKTYVFENNYITGITEDGTDYSISSCAQGCKRCYSSSSNDCYECDSGYTLYGKECKFSTGYFFKTPANNAEIKSIEITTKNANTHFDIINVNPITITLYIKYFGIDLDKFKKENEYYILACFYIEDDICKTYIGYKYYEKNIVFVVKGEEIYSSNAKNYIGIWTFFGISIHRQTEESKYFPNMLNFMIDQQELIPISGFDPTKNPVYINTFTIYTESVCLYSSFRVYSTFYFGPYGHVNAKFSTKSNNLLYQVNLYGTSSFNCLTNPDLAQFPSITITNIGIECVGDYQPYEETINVCSDDSQFMDLIYKLTPPCESCHSQCITNCFDLESSACTCDYYEGLYWVKTDSKYQSYECQRVDSINFAFFEPIIIYGLSESTNDEKSIAFWLNIYEYLDNNFDSLEIIWNQHLAVKIYGNGKKNNKKFLTIECHADYDINNPNIEKTIIYDKGRLKFNEWNYIVCQADKFFKVSRLNGLREQDYIPIEYNQKILTGSLTIQDKTEKFNYGFSFVRELKLYSSYNFPFWDDSHYNVNHGQFQYLLHYFHNDFTSDKLSETRIIDEVTGTSTLLRAKSNRIGYNYIIGYENLIICNEGYVYSKENKTCVAFFSEKCIIPRNTEDNCLLCSYDKPYLKETDSCFDNCGPKYYNDHYLKQCRKCDSNCHTCSGKYNNNCTSCSENKYYIESLHICVLECQEYGLVKSTKIDNTCEELIVETYISVPVYLNNSYDYNPLNKDYSSKVIPRNSFNQIIGHIQYKSAEIKTKWVYNWEETLEINKPYRLFKLKEIPEPIGNLITSDPNELSISVRNDYFKDGYKYVFDLEITSTSGSYELKRIHRYIILMNDYPDVGEINILPNKGYLSTNFLITINQCKDDLSNKDHLQYKFSYFTKQEDIQIGNSEQSPDEILIQNWSRNSEALYQFPELNPLEGNKYYIRGYCMDEFGLYYSEIQEVEVYDTPTSSNIDIPLIEAIKAIDINEELNMEQLLKRAEFLASSTLDYEKKVEILNRTNVTDFNNKGLWQEKLILYDPTSSKRDLYCNFRGDSYVIYFYLFCDCYEYDGNMCQIDHPSFDYIIDVYNNLLYKTKIMQTRKFNIEIIKTIELLMKSAASFMNVENMDFFLDSINIINSHMNLFATDMLKGNNYVIYFNIYNSLIEYGISLVNKLKYKNFIDKNIKNLENLYNADKMRNATLSIKDAKIIKEYFYNVKFGLQSLLEFYALNKKEFRFINNNINIYVLLVDENFPFDTYFSFEKKIYEPYMDFKNCLEKNIHKGEDELSYRLYFSAIVWKVSTYMYDKDLYWDTISPTITFKFIDFDTGEKVYLSNCGKIENQIKLFFPIKDYKLIERINTRRDFLSPENQYSLDDDIYCDPVYINKSGEVINTSPEERRKKYFLGFNFSCEHYNSLEEDKDNIILSKDSLEYYKYTKDNYVQCLLNKLMQKSYDEYVVNFYSISHEFKLNSRLFYLRHYQLLYWSENYKENYAFYYHIIIVIIYVLLSLVYVYIEKSYYTKMQTLSLLKSEIAKMNLPYKNEYLFDNELLITEDIKSKMAGKRKPNIEEMHLDVNNLNIGIMADEVAKYKSGFKSKEIVSTFNYNPNYFEGKDTNKKIINKKFFPKNNEIPPTIFSENDEGIPIQKFQKMKKFYQVGFKGLNVNENNEKEMQLSDDKKNIIVINKKQKLDKIMEINEENEDEDDIEIKAVNFFDKKSSDIDIDSNKDKETTIKKTINKKKIPKNLTKYQDYISSNEDMDSKSKLRDSKRETAKTKFFNLNPPKKEKNININSDKFVFTEKDQKKIGKSNSLFFNSGSEGLINNKKKEKNIFQKDYESIYSPKFKGPKVIGENLDFYNNETEFFEQNKDTDNKNLPYYGSKKPRDKLKLEEDLEKDKPKMKFGFYYKTSQIDLQNNEEKLPKLPNNLNFEQTMEEFHNISISLKGFIIRNITSRYILLTTFSKMNIFYKRYMRAGNFAAQLSLFALFLSISFSNNEKMDIYETGNKKQILNFFWYCFLSDVLSCIMIHIPAYCFCLNEQKIRRLYNMIRTEEGMHMIKQINAIANKGRFFWNILGLLLQLIYIFFGFYFSFGFCATYYYQRNSFCLALVCTCGIDFLFTEFIWEIIIGLLYYISDLGRIPLFFGTLFNRLRNIKHNV